MIQPRAAPHRRRETGAVGRSRADLRVEAEEAQDAQMILGDAPRRIADEADAPRRDVGEPSCIIMQRARRVERQSVDGEIAAQRVGGEIAPEPHDGVPPVRLDVLAQRRHFKRRALGDERHSAMRDAGGDGAQTLRRRARHDLGGRRGRGDVDIARRRAEQHVAHRAADDARLLAAAVQQLQHAPRAGPRQQRARVRRVHSILPGTSRPFSIWACE